VEHGGGFRNIGHDRIADDNKEDQEQRNTMAARSYYQAFQAVKESISKVLKSENPGIVADHDHGTGSCLHPVSRLVFCRLP